MRSSPSRRNPHENATIVELMGSCYPNAVILRAERRASSMRTIREIIMTDNVRKLLAQARFYTDSNDYVLIKLPARAITVAAGILAEIGEPFGALVADKDEVTLLTYLEAVEDFKKRLEGATVYPNTYRLITIDVELAPSITGFMAYLSRALAENGISILPYAAFSRDHILVPADKLDDAITTLKQLQSSG